MTNPIGKVGQIKETQIVESPRTDLLAPKSFIGIFKVGDTTPSIKDVKLWRAANSAPVTVVAFDDGQIGQEIFILGDGQTTVANNARITTNTGANVLLTNGKLHLFVLYDDNVWHQL